MRVFIAVNFNDEVKEHILSVQRQLKRIAKKGRFTHPDNLHLTLVFLGEIERAELEKVFHAADSMEQQSTEFRIDGLGKFRRDGGDIWWLGVKNCVGLMQIQSCLAEKLREAGFEIEDRAFKPHLTLARECIIAQDASLPVFEARTVRVGRISIMQSERIAGRLIYTELHGKNLQ